MGFSDSGIFLSDQNNLCETELGFLREPSLGFSDRSVHASPDQHELQERDLETKSQDLVGVNIKKEVEEEDCCKTPTRPDQIIPAITKVCPPAPRKPRRFPSRSLKVKDSYRSRRMILLNLSREIDCLFHETSLCNKIKKARHI